MKFREIKNNIFYCGLNDRERKLFDELIPLDMGTSYNSYLIKGSEKTALIDTMYPPFEQEYIRNLDENGVEKVDYIIANHGEQDHTGILPELIKKYPEAVIVTNAVCKGNIVEMLLVPEDKIKVIKNEEELSLGDKTLKFILAPGVHWPDTMFTHAIEDNMLFTCDFLGAHYTFDELFADESKELERGAKKYYAEIMMPFRAMCKKYTAQIKEIKPDMVLPSHGPIYKNPDYILNLYTDWTSDETKNLAVFPYVSMYQSSEEMVDYAIEKLTQAGIECYKFDIVKGNLGDFAIKIVDARTIVLGCSMVLAHPHPAAMNAAYLLKLLRPKAQYASIIASYGWGGKLIEPLLETLSTLNLEFIEPVYVKGKAKEEDYKKIDILADKIIEKHKIQ
jgi:flavorubredoxin